MTLLFEEYQKKNDPNKPNYQDVALDEKDGFTKVIGRKAVCTESDDVYLADLSDFESLAQIK